jgi:hypothetical protein
LKVFIKITHAKKVELEYLADLRHCARCFGIQNAFFLHSEQAYLRGCLHDGKWDDFDVFQSLRTLNESSNAG